MPADTSPPKRVTTERIAALCAHYARMMPLLARAGWRFVCSVVPGLKDPRTGVDAWALVLPDTETRTATVRVRDIDATPIPGFDGDPMLEIRVTVAHELFHCVVAEAVGPGGVLTIPAEEQIVETAAQAMVRSEGLDARVMARAVRALPSALRARVAASAGQRARGGYMDGKQVLAAIAGQDEAAALTILESWAAEQIQAAASSGGADTVAATDSAKIEPSTATVDPMMQGEEARRAKGAAMDEEKARARQRSEDDALRADLRAIHATMAPAAKEGIVVRMRARLGPAFKTASEKRIMAAPTYQAAEEIASVIEETIGEVSGERARSGIDHINNGGPDRSGALPTLEQLKTEGFNDSWLRGFQAEARRGPEYAQVYIDAGRASSRARTAKPDGGAA